MPSNIDLKYGPEYYNILLVSLRGGLVTTLDLDRV